jgi:hypothetical protein
VIRQKARRKSLLPFLSNICLLSHEEGTVGNALEYSLVALYDANNVPKTGNY